jgi:hypothetical protein
MKVAAIKRTDRLDRSHWEPCKGARGYQLVNRTIPYPDRNLAKSATFVSTLAEAADLIATGYAIRMCEPGKKSGDYIYPEDLGILQS